MIPLQSRSTTAAGAAPMRSSNQPMSRASSSVGSRVCNGYLMNPLRYWHARGGTKTVPMRRTLRRFCGTGPASGADASLRLAPAKPVLYIIGESGPLAATGLGPGGGAIGCKDSWSVRSHM